MTLSPQAAGRAAVVLGVFVFACLLYIAVDSVQENDNERTD